MNAPQLIPIPVDDPLPMAWLDMNDLGNAHRLVRLARGLLRWVDELGWLAYDGRRWSTRDGDQRARELAHEVAHHIDREHRALAPLVEAGNAVALEEALGWPCPLTVAEERVKQLRGWAVKSGDTSRSAAMLVQARTLLRALRENFDKDPLAINLDNGTLRFIRKEGGGWVARLDLHEPRDMIMQLAAVTYDDTKDCPLWRKRLELIQPAKDQRALLQTIYGYILTGLTSEQKWLIFQGRGGDGKTVTNMVIANLLGDYCRHADIKTFLLGAQKSGSDHSSDLARLQGDIRFVYCDEPVPNSTWDASRLKQVTGGTVTCRPMRKEEIEYKPRWKLIVEVNPLPKVPSDDDGFWRRVRPIPFEYQFDKGGEASEPMEIVVERLMAEGAGILNWMIAGAVKWLEARRLPVSVKSGELFDNYRLSASPFGQWLIERGDTSDREAITPASVLYQDFKEFCTALGIEKPPSQTAFGIKLRDLQCHVKKDPATGNSLRKGIKLKPNFAGSPLGAAGVTSNEAGAGGRETSPLGPQDDVPFGGPYEADDI